MCEEKHVFNRSIQSKVVFVCVVGERQSIGYSHEKQRRSSSSASSNSILWQPSACKRSATQTSVDGTTLDTAQCSFVFEELIRLPKITQGIGSTNETNLSQYENSKKA